MSPQSIHSLDARINKLYDEITELLQRPFSCETEEALAMLRQRLRELQHEEAELVRLCTEEKLTQVRAGLNLLKQAQEILAKYANKTKRPYLLASIVTCGDVCNCHFPRVEFYYPMPPGSVEDWRSEVVWEWDNYSGPEHEDFLAMQEQLQEAASRYGIVLDAEGEGRKEVDEPPVSEDHRLMKWWRKWTRRIGDSG